MLGSMTLDAGIASGSKRSVLASLDSQGSFLAATAITVTPGRLARDLARIKAAAASNSKKKTAW